MGKASRRKRQTRDFADEPIRVINEDTGEVIETFYNPKVARYLNDRIKKGATKEEITQWVNEGLEHLIEERKKALPHDGETQHG